MPKLLRTIVPRKAEPEPGVEDFIARLKKIVRPKNGVLMYRGHSNARKYKLNPSLFRKPPAWRRESSFLRMLLASQPQEFSGDLTTLERLVRMQHYSLPTRLLDVTWNPLVALYFSSTEDQKEDGEVIVFKVPESKVKFFDSDTVSCIANLSYLTPTERNTIRDLIKRSPPVDEFNDDPVVKRLLQFIKAEKPYFLPLIDPNDLRKCVFVRPKQSNKRILAQNGAFIVFGTISEITDPASLGFDIERIKVPAATKPTLVQDLDLIGLHQGTMFPEIESAAKYISGKFL